MNPPTLSRRFLIGEAAFRGTRAYDLRLIPFLRNKRHYALMLLDILVILVVPLAGLVGGIVYVAGGGFPPDIRPLGEISESSVGSRVPRAGKIAH